MSTAPDYGTVFTHVNGLLMGHPWVGRRFSATPLAAALADRPRHEAVDVVAAVMTARRTLSLRRRPLERAEFARAAAATTSRRPDGAGPRDRFHDWYASPGVGRTVAGEEAAAGGRTPAGGSRGRPSAVARKKTTSRVLPRGRGDR